MYIWTEIPKNSAKLYSCIVNSSVASGRFGGGLAARVGHLDGAERGPDGLGRQRRVLQEDGDLAEVPHRVGDQDPGLGVPGPGPVDAVEGVLGAAVPEVADVVDR